jgi:hypothetical protein
MYAPSLDDTAQDILGSLDLGQFDAVLSADARDIDERAEHLQLVLGAVLDYVGAIVTDMDHVAPGGSIDRKYLVGLISDVAGEVAGSISNAADHLAAGRG